MRIRQIRTIILSHLPAHPLLLLLANPTRRRRLIPLPVLPHIIAPPRANEEELGSQADARTDGAGDVAGGVGGFEDLAAAHVADAVADEGRGGDNGFLCAAGDVGGDCAKG